LPFQPISAAVPLAGWARACPGIAAAIAKTAMAGRRLVNMDLFKRMSPAFSNN
jgi:hypothetical protein